MIKKHHTARVPQLKHRQFKHWILQDRCQAEKRSVQIFFCDIQRFWDGNKGDGRLDQRYGDVHIFQQFVVH